MEVQSNSKAIILAIKDWMKRHAGQPVPGFKEATNNMSAPGQSGNYTQFKKRAFKELQEEGFKLIFTNEEKTIAYVDGYIPPVDAGEKIASKIIVDEEDELDDFIVVKKPNQPDSKKPEKKQDDRPPTYIFIHKTGINPRDCAGCADFIAGIASMPDDIKLELKILIKEV